MEDGKSSRRAEFLYGGRCEGKLHQWPQIVRAFRRPDYEAVRAGFRDTTRAACRGDGDAIQQFAENGIGLSAGNEVALGLADCFLKPEADHLAALLRDPCGLHLAQGHPLPHLLNNEVCQFREILQLILGGGGMRRTVQNAECAKGGPVWTHQGRSGVELEKRGARNQRMIAETRIQRGIGHNQGLARNDAIGAERGVPLRFPVMGLAIVEPGCGFEPEPVAIRQSNEGKGRTHGARSNPGDPVEGRFGRRVQNFEVLEVAEAQFLVDRNRGWRQFKSSETGSAPGLGKPVTNLENQRASKRRSLRIDSVAL